MKNSIISYQLQKTVLILIATFLFIIGGCFPRAEYGMTLHTASNPAVLEPYEYLEIIKIDEQMVDVRTRGTLGTPHCRVSIDPGKHQLVVYMPYFREGSAFFLNISVKPGRVYAVKWKPVERTSGLTWLLDVWVEDASTGERVSTITRNL